MMEYAVIAENDVSAWDDDTGVVYHFPSRYAKFLKEGTRLLYYKGKLKDKTFLNNRLSADPHYFGIAIAGIQYPDKNSPKGDKFVTILNFTPFQAPVPIRRQSGETYEIIPENRKTNYWRDGCRQIDQLVYDAVVATTTLAESGVPQGCSTLIS